MPEAVYHIPALLPQTIEALDIRPDGTYIDVTYGGGGHSRAIVEKLSPEGHLYGFDQDMDAVSRAMNDSRFTIVHSNFRYIVNFMRYYKVDSVDGILADLGVSFHHFDDPERGFSFRWDGPLDMRMNRNGRLTAAQVVNTYPEERLADIFYLLGELKNARRIAAAIVKARTSGDIDTIEQLLAVIEPLIDPARRKKELAKVFQALRIEVNHELDALEELLQGALTLLKTGGRIAVITYHSLEDRLVKNFFRTGNFEGRENKDFFGRSLSPFKLLTSRPIVPDDEEVDRNPRSRSAKLRVAAKL